MNYDARFWIRFSGVAMVAAILMFTTAQVSSAEVRLIGSGATFPFPIYSTWFKDYNHQHNDIQINYQGKGSGAGIKDLINHTVDFTGSDAAMTDEEMAEVKEGVQLLPMTAGSIVLAYNLPGIPEGLKLSREVYSKIFLAQIKKWSDPLIAKDNAGVALPDLPINVVVRADGSGTTFVFTKHLSAISPEFAQNPGNNILPNWPTGTRSKGNEGVTASVMTTPGAIGYIEFGYAKSQNLPMATLENKSGSFVVPSTASGTAALASAQFPEDLIAWVPDPDGKDSYPIATYTWLICYKQYNDKGKLQLLQDLLTYCVTDGQKESEALGYLPLPQAVADKDKAAIQTMTLAPNAT